MSTLTTNVDILPSFVMPTGAYSLRASEVQIGRPREKRGMEASDTLTYYLV
jgi:hypothetical protein